MGLYRQIDFNLGTANDRFGAVPTITGSTFSQKEKGWALEVGNGKYIQYNNQVLPNNAFTVVIWVKINEATVSTITSLIGAVSTGSAVGTISTFSATTLIIYLGTNNAKRFVFTNDKKWHCFIFTCVGAAQSDIITAKAYQDGIELVSDLTVSSGVPLSRSNWVYVGGAYLANPNSCISKLKVYDHVLTQKQIEAEQREFVNAKPILKPKRGFMLNKSGDLSSKKYDNAGSNLITPLDFNNWVSGGVTINNNSQFTCNGLVDAYVAKNIFTVGKKYSINISGSVSTGNMTITGYGNVSGVFSINYIVIPIGTRFILDPLLLTTATITITNLSIQELTGLVAAYNMKPIGNTLVDISGNGNNGNCSNIIKTKLSTSFNGINSNSVIAGSNTLSGNITISCVVLIRGNGGSGGGRIFDNSIVFLIGGSTFSLSRQGGSGVTSASIEFNKWYVLSVTSSAAGVTNFYINGLISGTPNQSTTVLTGTTSWNIGNRTALDRGFNGEIQDLRIHNRVLTTQEIKSYHNSFVKPYITEDFSNVPADGSNVVPNGWIKGTGNYKVGEFVKRLGNPYSSFDFTTWFKVGGCDTATSNSFHTNSNGGINVPSIATLGAGKLYKVTYAGTTNSTFTALYTSQGQALISSLTDTFNSTVTVVVKANSVVYLRNEGAGTTTVTSISVVELNPLPTFKQNTKYLECTTAGTIAIPSDMAYGSWEFDWYKGGGSNSLFIQLIGPNYTFDIGTSVGSYALRFDNYELLGLVKTTVGTSFTTANSYLVINTWYRIKITRTQLGVFTTYIKGGVFGNNWVLVSTSGGSGQNPVTDNTYNTSNYFVLDLDVSDRFANLIMYDGIKQ